MSVYPNGQNSKYAVYGLGNIGVAVAKFFLDDSLSYLTAVADPTLTPDEVVDIFSIDENGYFDAKYHNITYTPGYNTNDWFFTINYGSVSKEFLYTRGLPLDLNIGEGCTLVDTYSKTMAEALDHHSNGAVNFIVTLNCPEINPHLILGINEFLNGFNDWMNITVDVPTPCATAFFSYYTAFRENNPNMLVEMLAATTVIKGQSGLDYKDIQTSNPAASFGMKDNNFGNDTRNQRYTLHNCNQFGIGSEAVISGDFPSLMSLVMGVGLPGGSYPTEYEAKNSQLIRDITTSIESRYEGSKGTHLQSVEAYDNNGEILSDLKTAVNNKVFKSTEFSPELSMWGFKATFALPLKAYIKQIAYSAYLCDYAYRIFTGLEPYPQ